MPQSQGTSFTADPLTFIVRHQLWDANVEDHSDQGISIEVAADLGERWNAIVAAAVALSTTPITFGSQHVKRLRRAGLDDLAIADVIHAASFFNWANRLMLSLGEPAAAALPPNAG